MISINRQLRKYFVLISFISVLFITIVSNISINYFFSNYLKTSRNKDDYQLVDFITKLNSSDGSLDERSLMNIKHYAYS